MFVLDEVQYLERIRNFGAAPNQPYSYRLADLASRFDYGLVVPNASAIETAGARSVKYRSRPASTSVWLDHVQVVDQPCEALLLLAGLQIPAGPLAARALDLVRAQPKLGGLRLRALAQGRCGTGPLAGPRPPLRFGTRV